MSEDRYEFEYMKFCEDSRQCWEKSTDEKEAIKSEYIKQQQLYDAIADIYDESIVKQDSTDTIQMTEQVCKLFPDNKDIKILDYGCGSGRTVDEVVKAGFHDFHGLDPNRTFLDIAVQKGHYKKVFQLKCEESHEELEKKYYDLVVSSGTFFCTASHPTFECFRTLCGLLKKGGYIVLIAPRRYYEATYARHDALKALEDEGKIKSVDKKLFPGYRRPFTHETPEQCYGLVLTYQVLV